MSASGSGSGQELVIRTRRLQLVAMTLAHIEAELQGGLALGPLLGVAIPSSWPPGEYDRDAMQFLLDSGTDELGLILMDEQLPERVRQRKSARAL